MINRNKRMFEKRPCSKAFGYYEIRDTNESLKKDLLVVYLVTTALQIHIVIYKICKFAAQ